MKDAEHLRCGVIPDSHGHYDDTAKLVSSFYDDIDLFIFAGDVLDGRDCRRLVGLILDLGKRAVCVAGNREWMARNALQDGQNELVDVWRNQMWPGYCSEVLESYGVHKTKDMYANAKQLKDDMHDLGHLAWLNSLPPYYENNELVVVHAGPEQNVEWVKQAAYLDSINTPQGWLENEPAQIFDRNLARVDSVLPRVSNKLFITGHAHLSINSGERMGSQRVRLASDIKKGDPLLFWHHPLKSIVSLG